MDVSGPLHQIKGNARGDSSNGAHRRGQDHHAFGSVAAAGDGCGLITPAVATQLASLTAGLLAPEGLLGVWVAGDPDSQLGLPNRDGSPARDHLHSFAGFEKELQRPAGQGLG